MNVALPLGAVDHERVAVVFEVAKRGKDHGLIINGRKKPRLSGGTGVCQLYSLF